MTTTNVTKHTPGPWGVVVGSDNDTGHTPADVIGPKGHPLAMVMRPDPAAGGDVYANARLMAAAPDLLNALQHIVKVTNLKGSGHPLETQAVAAIKKATGQPQ